MVKGVRLEIPLKDIFKRHRCPVCGSQMKRMRCVEERKGSDFNNTHHADWHDNAEVKLYTYKYICEKCKQKSNS